MHNERKNVMGREDGIGIWKLMDMNEIMTISDLLFVKKKII